MRGLAAWLGRRGSVILIVAIAVLLPALAVLQYEWTGELSQLEQLRARTNLSAAAQQFSTRFDAMLAGLYGEYHTRLGGEAASAAHPPTHPPPDIVPDGLERAVYVIDQTPGGYAVAESDSFLRTRRPTEWPAWLSERSLQRTLVDDAPALVIRRSDLPGRWVVVLLDMDVLAAKVLPALVASSFTGGIPLAYDVLVNRDDDPSTVIYASRPGLEPPMFEPWVDLVPIYAVHGRDLDPSAARSLRADAAGHRWRFFIKGQDGALEAAVGAARRRNLGIGAGVLALLALSVGLLIVSAQRAERGVRDQLEVVARMSHELRTPLATITCAGENLAADVVGRTDVRQYGEIIGREGRRLNKTVTDILLCCRLQTRPDAALALKPVDMAPVIDRAIEDSAAVTGADASAIERDVEPGLPTLAADADALRAAIKNLVVNALRYGAGSPVRVSAGRARSGREWRSKWKTTAPASPTTRSRTCSTRSSAAGAYATDRWKAAASA
ncbi:MAG: HAMP domain-containing sensor histidine kinase [Vicinamibacterales bacterium]